MYQVESLNNQEVFKICGSNVSLQDPPICPFWESFGNVSYLVLGGIDTNFLTAPTTVATKVLSISFAIVAVLLLLNVIIAVINQSWNDVTAEGLKVFWGERARYLELAIGPWNEKVFKDLISCSNISYYRPGNMVKTIQAIWSFLLVIFNYLVVVIWILYGVSTFGILWPTPVQECFLGKGLDDKERHDSDEERPRTWSCVLCAIFRNCRCAYCTIVRNFQCVYRTIFVDQADDSKDDPLRYWWDYLVTDFYAPNSESNSLGEQIMPLLKFIFIGLVLFIWVLSGFFTFGLFWPRQVREFLFLPSVARARQQPAVDRLINPVS
jgi:hypothetical protein